MYYLSATIFMLVIASCGAIYEDQVGKFEWYKKYIGNPTFSHIVTTTHLNRIIVATEQNILASLNLDTLNIQWRQPIQRNILYTYVGTEIITVSGFGEPTIVRGWDINNGFLKWEWTLQDIKLTRNTIFQVIKQTLCVTQFAENDVTSIFYSLKTGEQLYKVSTVASVQGSTCTTKDHLIICLADDRLYVFEVAEKVVNIKYRDVPEEVRNAVTLKAIDGPLPLVAANNKLVNIVFRVHPEISILKIKTESCAVLSSVSLETETRVVSAELKEGVLHLKSYDQDGTELKKLSKEIKYPAFYGVPSNLNLIASGSGISGVLQTKDHTLIKLHLSEGSANFLATREESLASIVTVEIVDLPMSETDAAIEKEFGNKNGGIPGMFLRRLLNQFNQLKNFLLTLLDMTTTPNSKESSLVRDNFGLNKLIVVVTEPGSIFGIENTMGEIVWKLHVPDWKPFKINDSPVYPLFVLRSSIYSPYPPLCSALGRQPNGNGLIFSFNPIVGKLVEMVPLEYRLKQFCPIHLVDNDFVKGFYLMDQQNKVHVYPKSSEEVAKKAAASTYLYTADVADNTLSGFSLQLVKEEILAVPIWSVRMASDEEKIIKVVGKRDSEKVHSQGRVLGDRSVLYKYSNPNLVAVLSQGVHPSHKNTLNIYLLDVVSGQIVFSTSHRRIREPIHVVHSENWLVYSWYSEKNRRTELAVLELYEGHNQANASAFTSLDKQQPPLLTPMVERQAFIVPGHITFLRDTITEKGITNKDILVGLSSGGLVELPWAYIDPRRTAVVSAEMREEGIIPYVPELPLPSEAVINHNRSVLNARAAHTAPSSIESTCLVFVYGVDHYYTRVAPSKTFDLLKDDFDYFTIVAVLSVLTISSFLTKRLSAKKALKQAWK